MTEPDRPRALYVFGVGGQGREVAWFARARWGADLPVRFVVDGEQYLSGAADTSLVAEVRPEPGDQWVAAVGDIETRRQAVAALEATGMTPAQIVHPSVDLGAVEHLGIDVVVGAGAVLSVGVVVADHAHVNVGATISHDTWIGEYATVSPGVHIAGWVDVRAGAFIGVGASVVNGRPDRRLVIGEGAVVGAGACVLGPVEPGSLYAGVPATRKR